MKIREVRKEIKRLEKLLHELQDARCAKVGHKKGPGAFTGFSYCATCGSQIKNDLFKR